MTERTGVGKGLGMSRARLTAAALLSLAVVAGCGSDDGPPPSSAAAPITTTSSAVPTPSATIAKPTTSAAPAGCAAQGDGVPPGAHSRPTVDVDGDGRRDTLWLVDRQDGSVLVGITTASNATFSTSYTSASPVARSALAFRVDGQDLLIVSSGRSAALYAERSCSLKPVLNPQGTQYEFDLGFGDNGNGVGCSKVAGTAKTTLVGLKVNLSAEDKPVSVKRTQILVDGTRASNGRSDTMAATDPVVTSAQTISCGDLTIQGNGVSGTG